MSKYEDLQARCASLLDVMANDPDRPYWQLELVRITLESVAAAALLSQSHKKTDKSYAEMLCKVESLEKRYSELLYKLSEIQNDR